MYFKSTYVLCTPNYTLCHLLYDANGTYPILNTSIHSSLYHHVEPHFPVSNCLFDAFFTTGVPSVYQQINFFKHFVHISIFNGLRSAQLLPEKPVQTSHIVCVVRYVRACLLAYVNLRAGIVIPSMLPITFLKMLSYILTIIY